MIIVKRADARPDAMARPETVNRADIDLHGPKQGQLVIMLPVRSCLQWL